MMSWKYKRICLLAALLLPGWAASAQQQYKLGSFFDKWFIQGSAGVHATADIHRDGSLSNLGSPTLAAEIAVGKWFSPQFGAKVGFEGVSLAMRDQKAGFTYVHSALMWDLTNTIAGYNRNRIWNVVPYMHMGFIHEYAYGDQATLLNNEYAGGIGLLNRFRIHDHVELTADFRATLLTYDASLVQGLGYTGIGTGLFGVAYVFGEGGWKAREQVAGEEGVLSNGLWDNWFFQAGGGINGITGLKRWDSRGAPALELAAGKWFSPQFGARFGWQGIRFSRRGTAPVAGVLADDGREDFGFSYVHGDILWNFSNTVSRYREDRKWNVVPYVHMGLLEEYRVDQEQRGAFAYEFAAGPGLLNTFTLTRDMGLYADFRGFLLRGAASGDRATGLTVAGSALLGLYRNVGKSVFDQFKEEGNPVRSLEKNWALSLNIADYVDWGTVQGSIQYGISRHFSIDASARVNRHDRIFSAGARWWPWYIYSGWWLKGIGQVESAGEAYGAGLSLGYSLILTSWLNLDFGIGGWAGRREAENRRSWFVAPNGVTAALMFVL